LIGDVDYDGDPGAMLLARDEPREAGRSRGPLGTRVNERLSFKRLPGTKAEVEALRGLYRRQFPGREPQLITGAGATEQAFRDAAPLHRWVHLATHGYFLPPPEEDRQRPVEDPFGAMHAVRTVHPGLLSGIALAGANLREDSSPSASAGVSAGENKPKTDDGKLTALEVEGLDLTEVDLMVLSACQTALGRSERGEGMLGLQRALQLAGVKTSVTSLWSVDDTATRMLMTEFYTNLWQRKLGKLESLRQAQLTMLKRYDPVQRKLRGLDLPNDNTAAPLRGSPFYWAAFVLSGDFR
jgi:CHAT domain-containing protein